MHLNEDVNVHDQLHDNISASCSFVARLPANEQATYADENTKHAVDQRWLHLQLQSLGEQSTSHIQSVCHPADIGNLAYVSLYAQEATVRRSAASTLYIVTRAITHGTEDMIVGSVMFVIGLGMLVCILAFALNPKHKRVQP
jgi:hypothetical protein